MRLLLQPLRGTTNCISDIACTKPFPHRYFMLSSITRHTTRSIRLRQYSTFSMSKTNHPVNLVSVNTAPDRAKKVIGAVIEGVKDKYSIIHAGNSESKHKPLCERVRFLTLFSNRGCQANVTIGTASPWHSCEWHSCGGPQSSS